jgi:hypothetical protein
VNSIPTCPKEGRLAMSAYYDIDVFTTADAVTRYAFEFKFNTVVAQQTRPLVVLTRRVDEMLVLPPRSNHACKLENGNTLKIYV